MGRDDCLSLDLKRGTWLVRRWPSSASLVAMASMAHSTRSRGSGHPRWIAFSSTSFEGQHRCDPYQLWREQGSCITICSAPLPTPLLLIDTNVSGRSFHFSSLPSSSSLLSYRVNDRSFWPLASRAYYRRGFLNLFLADIAHTQRPLDGRSIRHVVVAVITEFPRWLSEPSGDLFIPVGHRHFPWLLYINIYVEYRPINTYPRRGECWRARYCCHAIHTIDTGTVFHIKY